MNFIILAIILILVIITVREKVKIKKKRALDAGLPEEIKGSPISQALAELVAIAGGIYVSLLMLTTFLAMDLPSKITVFSMQLDTIAAIALGLTLAQPFILKLTNLLKKR